MDAPSSPLAGYQRAAGAYDEMVDADGVVRTHWQPLVARLEALGTLRLERRWTQSQRLIYQNGIAYTPHHQPDERPRPWSLDPLPLVVAKAEWQTIAAGLSQRATLLELVLRDLYGPQQLIRSGALPADLLYAHLGYLLPLRQGPREDGAPSANGSPRRLPFYAADLGRSPDGAWWVLADRTEAPSGIGYALENRIVVSRMLPESFRECHVQRLAGYFEQLRESLQRIAPDQVRNPRVAILSQGPGQPNYFEDAYLARYLGYTLVEGEDLTVRNRRMWLKTLEGLAPIDVIIRRPNTDVCDPLELGGESPCGVAGMLQAARDGAVAIANPLGCGLVESPAFMAYLPRLCQALLDEPLKLPGVATWWCGESSSRDYVLANLDQLVVKHAYRSRGQQGPSVQQLATATTEQLAERIRSDPHAYVAQEKAPRSSAPTWRDGHIVSSRLALRAFAVGTGDGFQVLDGALARTTSGEAPLESSIVSGEGSKDVWIVGDESVEPRTLLTDEDQIIELVRLGDELPSRVAGNSFWLGRHIERADAKARLLRSVAMRLAGERDPRELPELLPLLRALAAQGQIEPGYVVDRLRDLLPHVDQSLPSQVLSRTQVGSLSSTVESIFTAAAQVRDRLSGDAWRTMLRINDALPEPPTSTSDSREPHPTADLADLINITDELIVDVAAFGGMVIEGMTRTQFYRFLDIGRRLERAMQLVELLRTCLLGPPLSRPKRTESRLAGGGGRALLEALLETSDSLMTYRSRYRANIQFAAVLDLLVTDESNPRSLAFQLNTLERHVTKLPRSVDDAPGVATEQRLALAMAHAVRLADAQDLAGAHAPDGEELEPMQTLADLLAKLAQDLPELSDAISLKYLVHAGAPRQLPNF